MNHIQNFSISYDYPVSFGHGFLRPESSTLVDVLRRKERDRRHRVLFVVDEGVAACRPDLGEQIRAYERRHARSMQLVCEPLVVDGGEGCKNDPDAPLRLAKSFDQYRLDRQSFVVVVGGGALQDMAGYAAATFHRGVRVVRMPTTVLSQADSGVGVKNGVNALGKKNVLGAFAPPFAVLADLEFLDTLDARDKVAGMAEAVKVALIKDSEFFVWIARHSAELSRFAPVRVAELVERCAVLHLEHIARSGDPFELGSSRPLDFGHWAAHRLESLSGYALRHGEAVAIGIALDARYSVEAGLLSDANGTCVVDVLGQLGLPTWHPLLDTTGADGELVLLRGLDEFREHLGGELTITLLEELGKPVEVHAMNRRKLAVAIDWLCAKHWGDRVRHACASR